MHRFQAGLGRPDPIMLGEVVQMHAKRLIIDVLVDIYDTGPEIRQGTDLLILRLPVEQQWDPDLFANGMPEIVTGVLLALLGAPDVAVALERVDDRPVHLLNSFRGQQLLSPSINSRFPRLTFPDGMTDRETIEDIQTAEFDHLLDRSRAIIMAAPGTVFEAPSGRLVRHFVRVGNIQFSRDAVDALFFWLLPNLKRCAAILVDTWSISSVAFKKATLCQRYFGGGSRRVEFLSDYIKADRRSDARARSGGAPRAGGADRCQPRPYPLHDKRNPERQSEGHARHRNGRWAGPVPRALHRHLRARLDRYASAQAAPRRPPLPSTGTRHRSGKTGPRDPDRPAGLLSPHLQGRTGRDHAPRHRPVTRHDRRARRAGDASGPPNDLAQPAS